MENDGEDVAMGASPRVSVFPGLARALEGLAGSF